MVALKKLKTVFVSNRNVWEMSTLDRLLFGESRYIRLVRCGRVHRE